MYKSRILFAVTGLSAQVVTETLYAIYKETPELLPNQIKILTTQNGAIQAKDKLLGEDSDGFFYQFLRDYELEGQVTFEASDINVICDDKGNPLNDLTTPEENQQAANQITAMLRTLTEDENSQLHVSIAGGRKTMSYYLGSAFQFYARPQDVLSHVLVSAPYEHPEFYYKPQQNKPLTLRDGSTVNTDDAVIWLSRVPVIKLRSGLNDNLMNDQLSFNDALELVENSYKKPIVTVDLVNLTIYIDENLLELTDIQKTIYATFLIAKKNGQNELKLDQDYFEQLIKTGLYFYKTTNKYLASDKLKGQNPDKYSDMRNNFNIMKSRIKNAIEAALVTNFNRFTISKSSHGKNSGYYIDITSECIRINYPEKGTILK